MKNNKDAKKIINILEQQHFFAECPCCNENVFLKDAGLFYLDDFTPEALEVYKQQLNDLKEQRKQLKEEYKKISERSEIGAEKTNLGFILERLAPVLKGFRFNKNDCRTLFDPIDYVIFEGLNHYNRVDNIFFVDIKTGAARLTKGQREISSLIQKKKIEFKTYKPEVKE